MDTIKELLTVILIHCITVYMNHKNIVYDIYTMKIVIRWCLLLEQYFPIIENILGTDNDVVDTLSRIPLILYDLTESNITGGNSYDS